jgi:hypothetical protein
MSRNAFWYSIETMDSKELDELWKQVEDSNLQTLAKEKMRSVILYAKEELDNRDFFPITSVSKDDMRGQFSDNEEMLKKIDKFSDSDMEYIASKMADAWCDDCYWTILETLVEDYELSEDKEMEDGKDGKTKRKQE